MGQGVRDGADVGVQAWGSEAQTLFLGSCVWTTVSFSTPVTVTCSRSPM